jgi:ribosome-associated heat shock protein Hsp15
MNGAEARIRLDKWLWAARFFKTRTLAATAIDGGKVRLNGVSAKPAKEVAVGDRLDISLGEQQWSVVVQAINGQRRPASEARRLYAETAESVERRRLAAELRRLAPAPGAGLKGRPTKRAGRQIRRFAEA